MSNHAVAHYPILGLKDRLGLGFGLINDRIDLTRLSGKINLLKCRGYYMVCKNSPRWQTTNRQKLLTFTACDLLF